MTHQTPSIGRIVLFKSRDLQQLGARGVDEVPAIITRISTDMCVDLTVFRYQDTPIPVHNVTRRDDFDLSAQDCAWRWPSRD